MNPSEDLYNKIGQLTRQLHDNMQQIGVIPKLQSATADLPDAKSRLSYVAQKTEESATRVLNLVDQAKEQHRHIMQATTELARELTTDPVRCVARGDVMNFVQDVETTSARIDAHLTDIMMAQDYQDLTGQVVKRVLSTVSALEASLLEVLVQASKIHQPGTAPQQPSFWDSETPSAPHAQANPQASNTSISGSHQLAANSTALNGPAIDGQANTVSSQKEVDELLSQLGF